MGARGARGKEMWECESMEMVGWWNEAMSSFVCGVFAYCVMSRQHKRPAETSVGSWFESVFAALEKREGKRERMPLIAFPNDTPIPLPRAEGHCEKTPHSELRHFWPLMRRYSHSTPPKGGLHTGRILYQNQRFRDPDAAYAAAGGKRVKILV